MASCYCRGSRGPQLSAHDMLLAERTAGLREAPDLDGYDLLDPSVVNLIPPTAMEMAAVPEYP